MNEPIYQTGWPTPETVWGDVSKDVYDTYTEFGYTRRRIVYLGSPAPIASASEGAPVLDKPAKVGGARFGKGVKWSTVIGAAQRHYEYEVTPEKEAARIARAGAVIDSIQRGDYSALAAPMASTERATPVAWMYKCWETVHLERNQLDHYYSVDQGETYVKGVPLYTHPTGAQPSTSTEESVPKPKPFEKRPITEERCMNMARLEGDSEIGACNPLKYPRIFVDSAIPGDPIEMALCSTEQVFLKPNQLYRFYVKESCAECSRIADPVAALVASSSEAIGWTTQFDLDCVNRGETGVIFKHKDQADSNIALYTHPAAVQPSRAEVLETRELPPLHGVSRIADNPCALMLLLKREPTDDDLREIHDVLSIRALKDKP
jgi:hypothetical protein